MREKKVRRLPKRVEICGHFYNGGFFKGKKRGLLILSISHLTLFQLSFIDSSKRVAVENCSKIKNWKEREEN